jgi:hypothetical protein
MIKMLGAAMAASAAANSRTAASKLIFAFIVFWFVRVAVGLHFTIAL